MTDWRATSAVSHLVLARFSQLALLTKDHPPAPSNPTHTHTPPTLTPSTPHPQSVGISWPQSSLSHPVCFACLAGVATYVCVAHLGYWDPQGPDLSNCTSPWVNHIMQKVSLSDAAAAAAAAAGGVGVKLPLKDVHCEATEPFLTREDAATAGKDLGHASVFICSPQYSHFDAQSAASPLRRGGNGNVR